MSANATEPERVARAQRIRAAMPHGGLFAGKEWRVAPEPLLLPPELGEDLAKLGFRLRKFTEACNLLYRLSVSGKRPAWIAELLDRGKPRELVELARSKAIAEDVPRVLRPDVILAEGGFTITELDNVPGGIGLTSWLNGTYADEGFHVLGGKGMDEGFRALIEAGDIVLSEEAADYRPEMEWMAGRIGARVVDAHRLPDDLRANVYRFFELFDLPNIPGSADLLREVADGKRSMTPPPKPWIEEKLWFALFWLRPLADFWRRELGEKHFLALQKVIPRTWLMDPHPLPPTGVYPGLDIQSWDELKRFSQRERELVLKISGFSELAWGSRSVRVGQDLSQEDWARSIDEALADWEKHPWILQKFHHSRVFEIDYVEGGEIYRMKGRVRLCPYYFCGDRETKLGGVLATVCPADKKLLHGMRDAVLAPVVIGES
ncbi:MAG: hypothetical protein FGM15_08460 [Chthoniobacterales bacterium]|nr:hypothetical protein [Chthoniobacterales bacterium]